MSDTPRTDAVINIAIAEECGAVWKRQSCSPWNPDNDSRNVYFRRLCFIEPGDIRGPATLPDAHGDEMIADEHPIPDYCTDLNAMHEAEATLDDCWWHDYEKVLHFVIKEETDTTTGPEATWFASARQRAEAFLRVKGKWKE